MKILIIEDNAPLADLLVRRLEKRGHQVVLAEEAKEAQESAKAFHPDVVILEAQLRGGEDWAAARSLKFDDHTRDIPIVVPKLLRLVMATATPAPLGEA